MEISVQALEGGYLFRQVFLMRYLQLMLSGSTVAQQGTKTIKCFFCLFMANANNAIPEASGCTITNSHTNRTFLTRTKRKKDYWKCQNFRNVQCAMTPTMTAKRIFCLHRKQNKLHPPVLQTEQRLAFSKREESVNCNQTSKSWLVIVGVALNGSFKRITFL